MRLGRVSDRIPKGSENSDKEVLKLSLLGLFALGREAVDGEPRLCAAECLSRKFRTVGSECGLLADFLADAL